MGRKKKVAEETEAADDKRGRGRPILDEEGGRKTKTFLMRLNQREYDELVARAEAAGMKMSDYIRSKVFK